MATSKQTVRSYKHKFIFDHLVILIGCEYPLSFKSNLTTFIFELSPNVKNSKKICKKPIRYRVWQKCMVASGSSTRQLILIFSLLLLNRFYYCNIVWASTYKTNLRRLVILQKRIRYNHKINKLAHFNTHLYRPHF